MKGFSRGYAAPGAVIFLAVISLVVWYRNQNEAATTTATTTAPKAEARLSGEGKTSTIR
ncbi:MAG TPA: hypothetical protein VD967_02785 [Candidatus Paceibacterota bacterium]|nr:hypothetical protein [Candidatus Paceibacterota bacterium]